MAALIAFVMAVQGQNDEFNRWFSGGTLRIDCLRSGSVMTDSVKVVRWVDRKSDWFGSRTSLKDLFNNGEYRIALRDPRNWEIIYSRCYNNLFREYRDTPEGRLVTKSFEETLLVPMPHRTMIVSLQKRGENMQYVDMVNYKFDPESITLEVRGSGKPATNANTQGHSERMLDLAIVMQGFENASREEYGAACRRIERAIMRENPFHHFARNINLFFVNGDAGVEYNTFGADRYAMTFKVWQLHDLLGTTPADHIIIVLNNEKYGGGAIYNFYSVTSLHKMAESVLPHELGHGIGGLADEYVDEDLSYSTMYSTLVEPSEPNITNLVDFNKKWKKMLPQDTPVPTPDKTDIPRNQCGPLGVYEGAGYASKGVYRPAMHCMMRDYAPFCPVCLHHLELVIKTYTE